MVHDGPQFDGGYHYRGGADVFFHIGDALGQAMIGLVPDQPTDQSRQIAEAYQRAKKKYGFAD